MLRRGIVLAICLGACDGALLSPATPPADIEAIRTARDCSRAPITTAEQPLLRLTSEQYRATLRTLLPAPWGADLAARATFPETIVEQGFTTDANATVVNTEAANAIEDNAELLADYLLANADAALPAIMGCGLTASASDAAIDACVPTFIADFAARAYRRPPTDAELQLVSRVYSQVRTAQGARVGFAAMMQLFFQAPALLYRVERGGDLVADNVVALSGRERAVRLGYLLWNTAPDDALRAAAERGDLDAAAGVELEAQRLVKDPRVLDRVAIFHRDWLQVYKLRAASKDPAVFPSFDEAFRASAQEEPARFTEDVLMNKDGKLRTLLTTTSGPVNASLAAIYGVTAPASGWTRAELPHRYGILTLASTMSAAGNATTSATIHRGAFIRREILCSPPAAVPGNVSIAAFNAEVSSLPTARERLAPLSQREACMGCHTQINPFGLALEVYDGAGKHRTTENGAAIDTSGELGIGDLSGSFDDTEGFVAMLAESKMVRECYVKQMFRSAFGRMERAEDRCDLERLNDRFAASDGDIRDLLIALTQTNAFLYRSTPEGAR